MCGRPTRRSTWIRTVHQPVEYQRIEDEHVEF